jgi:hypothetical protein
VNIDHDHDDEGNCIPPQSNGFYAQELPTWRFSLWDVAGVAVSFVGSVAGSLGSIGINFHQACNLISRECQAAANYSRQNYELAEAHRLNEQARAQMSEGLEHLILGPEHGDLS